MCHGRHNAPECKISVNDKVTITRGKDKRTGQTGTVTQVMPKGLKVKFKDGKIEGFKSTSLRKVEATVLLLI